MGQMSGQDLGVEGGAPIIQSDWIMISRSDAVGASQIAVADIGD
jgi:hypothetical protein